jgi:hypothetical protein
VVIAAVDETAFCVYNKTEQLTYQLLIKLVISQTIISILDFKLSLCSECFMLSSG